MTDFVLSGHPRGIKYFPSGRSFFPFFPPLQERNSKGRDAWYGSTELVCSWVNGSLLNNYWKVQTGLLLFRKWMFLVVHSHIRINLFCLMIYLTFYWEHKKDGINASLQHRWWNLEWVITIKVFISQSVMCRCQCYNLFWAISGSDSKSWLFSHD